VVNRVDQSYAVTTVQRQDGMLRVQANLTRTGIFNYQNPDGSIRREYRPAEEVFSPASLASFSGRPLTVGHRLDAVTSNEWKDVAVGDVRDDAQRVDDYVRATVQVNHAHTIQRVDSKELVEVSCGYKCDLDPTPGTFKGEAYDAIQRNIRLNHVALLPSGLGRAGSDVRLLLDSTQDVLVESPSRRTMTTEDEDKARKERNDALDEVAKLKKLLAESEGKSAAQSALAEQARADAKRAEENLPAKIQARVKLEADAKRVFPECRTDGSDEDVMKQVVEKLSPTLRVDGVDALRGAYAALVGSWDGGRKDVEKAITGATTQVQKQDQTDAPNMVAEARLRNYTNAKAAFGMSDKKKAKLNPGWLGKSGRVDLPIGQDK
jgi:uncharacterized protein